MNRNNLPSINTIIHNLENLLQMPLPGAAAQQEMSPSDRSRGLYAPAPAPSVVGAGVLLLLYPHNNRLFIPLIHRKNYSGPHSGQISFPGGKHEKTDLSMKETALRETFEETGIPAKGIRILGPLTTLYIPVSNFLVYPFVGYFSGDPVFHPDTSEVEEIIPLDIFRLSSMKPGVMTMEKETTFISAPYFQEGEHKIWGATAMILNEFLKIFRKAAHL